MERAPLLRPTCDLLHWRLGAEGYPVALAQMGAGSPWPVLMLSRNPTQMVRPPLQRRDVPAGFQPDAGIVEAVPFFIEDALAMQQALVA